MKFIFETVPPQELEELISSAYVGRYFDFPLDSAFGGSRAKFILLILFTMFELIINSNLVTAEYGHFEMKNTPK